MLLVCLLAAFAGLMAAGLASSTVLPSITVEDGSTQTFANDSITIDGSLGGPRAGQVVVANGSRLIFDHVDLTVSLSPTGGIWVGSSSRLELNATNVSADASSSFLMTVTGGGVVEMHRSQLSGLQALLDLSAPAILVEAGSTLRATNSTLRPRPDVRPLLEAFLSTLDFERSTLTGALRLTQSTLNFRLGTLSVIGEATAVDATASTVTISNSSIVASGGASALSGALGSSVTVLSTNLTAEDIGVVALSGSSVTLRGVVVDAGGLGGGGVGAFGLVAQDASLTGDTLAVVGFPTSLWVKGSQAVLKATQFGTGLLRLNASSLEVDGSPPLAGVAILESASVLTLTDSEVNWSRLDIGQGSWVLPRFRAQLHFLHSSGAAAAGVNWQVFPSQGLPVGSGTSNATGRSTGPALEGPRYTGLRFLAPPIYRLQFDSNGSTLSALVTAWGPGNVFEFFVDPGLPSLGFTQGLSLSSANPELASTFRASALLGLSGTGAGQTIVVTLLVDGTQSGRQTVDLTPGAPSNVSFDVQTLAGFHRVALRADSLPNGGRFAEFAAGSDNEVAILYNASANTTAPVKPDLYVGGVWFDFENTTGRDPVTGETRQGLTLFVNINISNAGLTVAGPFDVSVAAGINTSRHTVQGIGAQSFVVVRIPFGPYIDSQALNVLVQLDVTDRVSESDETNNQAHAAADVHLPMARPVERPAWVTVLVLAAAAALIGLSVWGVLLVFRGEKDEPVAPAGESPKAEAPATKAQSPPPPHAPAPAGPAFTAPQPAPGYPPAQAPQSYYWGYPPYGAPGYPPSYAQGVPGGYPPYAYVPPPPLQPAPPAPPAPPPLGVPAPPGPASDSSAARPPALCPNCRSPQVSYLLHPDRQVVCTSCGSRSPF